MKKKVEQYQISKEQSPLLKNIEGMRNKYVFLEPFINLLYWILDFLNIIIYCLGIIILLLFEGILFIGVPQISHIVKSLYTANELMHLIIFQIFILWYAIQIWFIARTILNFININFINKERLLKFKVWIPRILGSIVIIIIWYSALKSSGINNKLVHVNNFILLLLYWFFVVTRRKFMKGKDLGLSQNAHDFTFNNLNISTFYLASCFILLYLFVFVSFSANLSIFIGTCSIIISALLLWGSVIHFLILLYYNRYNKKDKIRFQIIPIILITLFIISFFNNNNGARLLPKESQNEIIQRRDKIDENIINWIKFRKDEIKRNSKFPIFIIGVQGGGSRSAYWSSLLLSKFEEKSNKFHKHIYALSSVSGGSLGSAVFVGLLENSIKSKEDNYGFFKKSKNILGYDFLSPLTTNFLYCDALQRFIPVPINDFDRSKALERSWENSWRSIIKDEPVFNKSLYYIWYSRENQNFKYEIPSLFLNSTLVESGKRVILSNIDYKNIETEFIELGSKLEYLNRMRLSTAVLMSARFPYVTPTGRIYKEPDQIFKDKKDNIFGHLADGGYYDNFGILTIRDVLKDIDTAVKKQPDDDLFTEEFKNNFLNNIYLILIKNEEYKITKEKYPFYMLLEFMHPIELIKNIYNERSNINNGIFKNILGDNYQDQILEINIIKGKTDVPLGWFLSNEGQKIVDDYINVLFDLEGTGDESKKNVKKILALIDNYY